MSVSRIVTKIRKGLFSILLKALPASDTLLRPSQAQDIRI